MQVVIIRPPLVYGPGVKANFRSMMSWLRKGIPLPFGAVTENRRSLVALDNLVDLIATCAAHPRAGNETFLVSDGEDVSTADLLTRLGAALRRPARLIPVPPAVLALAARPLGRDFARRLLASLQVDIGKTRQLLGWTPPISVDEGLRRAADAFDRT
jgi:nucleoside-diphosphate-sugar epimerase